MSDHPEDITGRTEGPADPGGPKEGREQPTDQEVHDEISREILRMHEESYGSSAGNVSTHVSEDWVVVVLDDLELLPNEEFLVTAGDHVTVQHIRERYQQVVQANFRAAVERATGRRVIGFLSSTHVKEPRFSVETFKLG